jgi:multidrug efflux system outer membrane protein
MAPRYQPPPLPVADEYPADAAGVPGDAVDAETLGWREVFVDPGLQALIEQALQNNRDLRASVLRVEEARAIHGIQRADLFPDISMGVTGSRRRTPADLSIAGDSTVSSAYLVTSAVTAWELDFWGRVRSLDTAALERYLATDAARRAFTVSLVAQVADTWLVQRELDQRIELAQRSIATREESFRIFRRRAEEGASSRLDLTQVETLLRQAQSLGAQLEQLRAANSHALSLLVGASVDLTVQTGVFEGPDPIRTLRAGLPSDLLTGRPDIVAAEHQLKAAHANIGAARAAFFPSVSLTGDFGTASAEFNGLFESGSRAWSFLPSISLPIFSGGRLRSNLDLAEVRRDLAVANYEVTVQAAFRDVADALSAHHWLSEQVSIQRDALRVQNERSRLAKLRYDSGTATFLEVLDAQRDLLSTEQALVQAQRALQSSQIGLFAALGGGTLGAGE